MAFSASRIDKEWFVEKMNLRGLSLRAVSRQMQVDPSALTRTLSGERKMQLNEVPKWARILGESESAVLAHADLSNELGLGGNARQSGLAASTQESLDQDGMKQGSKSPARHPLFGCLKGTLSIVPGTDLTAPADPDLADYLDEKYGPEVRGRR